MKKRWPPTGPGRDGNKGLDGGGDLLSVTFVAYPPLDIPHNDVVVRIPLEGEVDRRDPHSGVGLVVQELSDVLLRLGFLHGGQPAELHPGKSDAIGLADERGAADVGCRGFESYAAGLSDYVEAWRVGRLVVGSNRYHDVLHSDY